MKNPTKNSTCQCKACIPSNRCDCTECSVRNKCHSKYCDCHECSSPRVSWSGSGKCNCNICQLPGSRANNVHVGRYIKSKKCDCPQCSPRCSDVVFQTSYFNEVTYSPKCQCSICVPKTARCTCSECSNPVAKNVYNGGFRVKQENGFVWKPNVVSSDVIEPSEWSDLQHFYVNAHMVINTGVPNYVQARIPVPTNLNIPERSKRLSN